MNRNCFIFVLLFCHFIAGTTAAQISAGKILAYKKSGSGISGTTSNGIFEIKAYSQHVFRVRFTTKKEFQPLPYALLASLPAYEQVKLTEQENVINISTGLLNAVVHRQPFFCITFKDADGAVLNEDVRGAGFGTSFIADRWTVYKKLQEGERFVGMGEALGNLDRRGTGITLNNTDTYKYGDPRLNMYSSIPFYMGFHHGKQYGIFYNNSYSSFFNFGLSTPEITSATFAGGDVDYFFIYDTSPAKIIEHYTSLTGRMQLPPIWGIGYHQSRCSYYPQDRVEWIASSFRSKKIPIDCIVLDADYQFNYQPFRVNKDRFPDMPALAKKLADMKIELTASVYPGVAIDSTYHSYKDGLAKNVFLKYANGTNFKTEIAPVKCVLPDYTYPSARQWWKDKMNWLPQNGIHGYWNDMNEPALGGSYVPDNVLFDFDGRKTNALEAKNVYGFQMARSSYEAALQNATDRRPFILTRSGFAGVQRYAALWSGDNTATDEGLLSSVLLNNQLGLSGLAFSGHDIGGFIGDGNKELYQRWIQVGVFSPFCRNHKGCGGAAGEPWAYGDEAEAISKSFIGLRYRLLPYLYAAFYEASQTGMPIVRSLCMSDPFDDKVYDPLYQYQFLFGNHLLVVPVTTAEKQKRLYLPKGDWFNLYTDERMSGNKELQLDIPAYQLPLFIKGSSIIPVQSLVQSTKESPSDTMVLHIYNGTATNNFTYYEDGGDGWSYKNGVYCKRLMHLNPLQSQLQISKQEGSFQSKYRKIQLVLHGFETHQSVTVNRRIFSLITTKESRLFNPLEDLKSVYDETYYKFLLQSASINEQQVAVIDFDSNEMLIEWK